VITVPTSSSLESINNAMTIAFWMKATTGDNATWVRIFQHGPEGSLPVRTWLVDRYNATDYTNVRVDSSVNNNQNIARFGGNTFDGAWHHVAYVLDRGRWWKYVDGVQTSGTYDAGDGLFTNYPLYIFGRNGYGQYVGQLDEIGIWNEVLPASSIQGLYDGAFTPLTAPVPEPSTIAMLVGLGALGLLGYWRRRRS